MPGSNDKTVDLGPDAVARIGERTPTQRPAEGYDPQKTIATDRPDPAKTVATGGPDAQATSSGAAAASAAEHPRPSIPEVTIDEEIGRGGMGVVYRGRQTFLDRRVAVKLLLATTGPNQKTFEERFKREAKILAGLSHPNIVACYQANQLPSGECYLVMEFIDGPNLRAWVEKNGPLSEVHALEVTRDTARALEHASRLGIIHRDVKPENVLLAPAAEAASAAPPSGGAGAGGGGRRGGEHRFPFTAKLVDLGLARPEAGAQAKDARLTADGVVMGTPSTMAPEQFDDPDHVDFRADIYGLGCILYHILTGEAAFPERNVTQIILRKARGDVPDPRALRPALRPSVAELVRQMLAPRREDRPQSYEAIIARCASLLDEAAASPRGEGTRRYYRPPDAVTGELVPGEKGAAAPSRISPERATAATRSDMGAEVAAARGGGGARALLAVGAVILLGMGALLARPYLFAPAGATGSTSAAGAGSSGAAATSGASAVPWKEPAAPPAAPALRYSDLAQPLFARDPNSRLADWTAVGATVFQYEDEEPPNRIGVQGGGSGVGAIRRDIGHGPWRVEGKLVPRDANWAGVVVHAGGRGVALALRGLGRAQVLTVADTAPASGEPLGFKVGDARKSASAVADKDGEIPFAITAESDALFIEAAGKPVEVVPLPTAEVEGVGLFFAKGVLVVRDLVKRNPAK